MFYDYSYGFFHSVGPDAAQIKLGRHSSEMKTVSGRMMIVVVAVAKAKACRTQSTQESLGDRLLCIHAH